jgi:PAS domain S-box-containing protein
MIGEDVDGSDADVPSDGVLPALADATDDILWLYTADWETVVFMNDAYEDLWGRSLAALREDPRDFVRGIHPEDRDDVREMMDSVSAGESTEVEIRVGPDYETWVHVKSKPITDDSEVTHVAGFTRDITERRRREQELRELKEQLENSNEELQQFAYVASHDLQEPLRMVRSYMNLLESEYRDDLDEEAQEYIDFAVDGAERMKGLVEGLLEFSRVETRGDPFEPVDADDVVERTLGALSMKIEETDATVETESLPTVTADRSQLSQVFQNLLSNALRYAGEDPPAIEIRGEQQNGAYVFAVDDDGVGIPEDKQAEMFEIFRRGAEVDGDGTGIGLAISERIAQRHGGEIWIDSAEGEGTTVYFSLPVDPENE